MLQYWSSVSTPTPTSVLFTKTQAFLSPISDSKHHNSYCKEYNRTRLRKPRKPSCILKLGVEDIAQIAQNKVLIAAGVSAAVGQLSKPFWSVILYGKDFDFRPVFQAGGFPSTHSSAVVATATCLGLERGFADSIFGLSVVYAGLIMYDAQGVRREVGIHARALNRLLSESQVNSIVSKKVDGFLSTKGRPSNSIPNAVNAPVLLESDIKTGQISQMLASSSLSATAEEVITEGNSKYTATPLKESIGHTEFEVIAGALLGLFVSLAVNAVV